MKPVIQWQVIMLPLLYQMDLLNKKKFGITQKTTYLNWRMREMLWPKPTQLGDTGTAMVLQQMPLKR